MQTFDAWKPPYDKLLEFAKTIPAQAGSAGDKTKTPAVPPNLALFALNCRNVAYANQFFDQNRKNKNVNMATLAEITALVGEAQLAKNICDKRGTTANGFQDKGDLLQQVWNNTPPGNAAAAVDALKYAYA